MTHRTEAQSPDRNFISRLMDLNVSDLSPKAQQ